MKILDQRRHVIIAEFDNCVRCGGAHENLDFEFLEQPMDVGGVLFTHWGLCPVSNTPILLKVDTQAA